MEPTGVKRKLAVILAADVEVYSRLMGAGEEATHKSLRPPSPHANITNLPTGGSHDYRIGAVQTSLAD